MIDQIPDGLVAMISACQYGKTRETGVRFPVEEFTSLTPSSVLDRFPFYRFFGESH